MIKSRTAIYLVIAAVIPVLSYTAFQFSQRSRSEALISSIYERQLDSILFSVNQHCWDRFSSWSTVVADLAASNGEPEVLAALNRFNQNHGSILGSFLWRSKADHVIAYPHGDGDIEARIAAEIEDSRPGIRRMTRRFKAGYTRPHAVPWAPESADSITLLIFPARMDQSVLWAGLFIDDSRFVNEIVARKFSEMDNGTFVFAVRRRADGVMIFSNEETGKGGFEKEKALWILPNLDLLIRLSGTTLEQLSKTRTQTNLLLLLAVNAILILGVVITVRNIGREMALAQQKTDFVANVSHELRTPLALIRMHAETLEMGRVRTEDKKQQYYRIIMHESARLTQLINNILDFAKIESHKKEYKLSDEDLGQLVHSTLEMYRFHLNQRGFDLVENIEPGLPVVAIDREAVAQALINLLDNAVKFSPGNKKIEIDLARERNTLLLSVRDHGIGIGEADQKRIFEKFYRAGSSLVHNTKGSGLGLSLVRHIMEVHGGTVTVRSKQGAGSTFALVFPIKSVKGG